jgi:catalase
MSDNDIAREAVEVLDIPGGSTKLRPVHTIGVGAKGHFVASDVARNYCIAEHFQGWQIGATVRFSNGSGSAIQHDGWSDVRGLAVRFHLADGAATDLLAMTLTEFFTPTPDTFLLFGRATKPIPVTRESAWKKLFDMLRLMQPLPDPYPGQRESANAGAIEFADRHAYSELSVFHAATIGAPVSYARAAYHAVHTFVVVAPDGARRFVRFSWLPVAGVRNTDPKATPCDKYLQQKLRDRLAQEPVRFILMMSIGEAGDDFNDPSRSWPPHRARVVMGTLTIDAVAEDQVENCERLSFNPWRLVAGIEPSDDPILSLRRDAYEFSRKRRRGIACPFSRS